MSKKRYLILFISLIFCAVSSLIVFSALYFGKKAYAAEHEKYNDGVDAYVKVDGTEFVFDNTGCATAGALNGGAATEDKTGGNDKPNKLYVGNLTRGLYTYLNFKGGIDSLKYNVIKIEWSKNINSKTTLFFYKNGDNPASDAPKDAYESGEGKYADVVDSNTGAMSEPRTTFTVNLYLPDFADEGTLVSGIIIKHQTDERDTDYDGFQLRIYSILLTNETFEDYSLAPDGKDFTVSPLSGYNKANIGVSPETGKIYCNAFVKDKGISFFFAESINSSVYKTISLKISMYINGFTLDDYYLNVYRGGSVSAVSVPVGGYVVKSTNDKSAEVALELEIPTSILKSEGVSVSSFSITNNGSKGGVDSSALSLFIWGIDVLKRESQSEMIFPISLKECALERKDSEMKIILGFSSFVCNSQTVITDFATDCDVYEFVSVDGALLKESDVKNITVGYKNDYKTVAIAVDSDVFNNDGTDVVKFTAGEFKIKTAVTNKFVISALSVYRLIEPVAVNETVLMSKESAVKSVFQSEVGGKIRLSVSFTETVGETDDFLKQGVSLNGKTLSELSDAVSISSEENVLKIDFDGACFAADENTLVFADNVKVGDVFLADGLSVKRYKGDMLWYIGSEKPLKVLWFEETDITDEFLTFKIKLSENSDTETDISSSVFMQKFNINGKTFYDIVKEGGLTAVLKGRFIDFKIKRSSITLNENESDMITFEKGFTLPTGNKTDLTKQFVYSDLWQNYEVVPDISSVKNKIQSTSIVGIQKSSDTKAGRLSLHIEFSLPVSYRFYTELQKEVCLLPSAFDGVASSNPSESYLSDLAFYGILDSCVKKIKFDGKSLEQWLKEYKIPGEDWNKYVLVSYLGTNLSNAFSKRVSVVLCLDDELTTLENSHTIEFERGFITPLLQTLNTTYGFKWDPEYERWVAFAENSDGDDGGGCSSVVAESGVGAAVSFMLCAFAVAFTAKRLKAKRQGGK